MIFQRIFTCFLHNLCFFYLFRHQIIHTVCFSPLFFFRSLNKQILKKTPSIFNKTKKQTNQITFYREWLLTKIVNGERASYSAPKFARMQERTRSQMLEDIVANLANHAETGQIPKPYRRGSWRPIGEDKSCAACCISL